MDGPLNQAHLEARKAERHEKAQKWEDAIASHFTAAELLQSAQKLTSDPKMLESLKLQREAHLRQRLLVEHRKNLSQFISKYQISLPGIESSDMSPVQNSHLRLTTTDPSHHKDAQLDLSSNSVDEDSVYKTLAECDSLLHILNKRGRPCGNTNAMQAVHKISATKICKDDRQIMEELKVQNDDLRVHILSLLHEADSQCSQIFSLLRENEELKQRLIGKKMDDIDTPDAVTEESDTTPPDENHSENTPKIPVDQITKKTKVISKVECHSEGHTSEDQEEEEEVDYFLNTNMEFQPLELPPLEFPEYQYQKSDGL